MLGALWTTSWAAPDPPIRVHLKQGVPAPSDGEFYSTEDARKLLVILMERRHRAEAAEENNLYLREVVALAEARVEALQAEIRELEATVAMAQADTKIEKYKCPSWAERHIGLSVGLFGGYNAMADVGQDKASVGIGLLYGFKIR